MVPWKMFVPGLLGKFAVIHLVIVPADALLGHPGRAAGLKNIKWPALILLWHPGFVRQVAEPFVLEMRKTQQIGKTFHFRRRVPARFFGPVEPEGSAGLRRKM